MSISYEITVLTTHILAKAEGSYELADAVRLVGEALAAASAHKQLRILIDARRVMGNPSMMQRFEFGEAVAKLYSQRPDRSAALIALVGNEPLIHPSRFGETVAVNRAVPVKATTDMQEAMDWLNIQYAQPQEKPTDSE